MAVPINFVFCHTRCQYSFFLTRFNSGRTHLCVDEYIKLPLLLRSKINLNI